MKKLACIMAVLLCLTLIPTATVCAAAASDFPVTYTDEDGEDHSAVLKTPGVTYSVIRLNGEEVTALNSDLRWDTEAIASKRVAYINAPRTGRSVVMKRASGSSHTIGRFKTGQIVLVMTGASGNYTGVYYNGKIGYVLTATLAYPDLSAGALTGVICWKDGSTDSNQSINIRQKKNTSSRKLTTAKVGTAVTVYSQSNGWAEIDVNGWHGFVQDKYLAVDDNSAVIIADEDAAEAADGEDADETSDDEETSLTEEDEEAFEEDEEAFEEDEEADEENGGDAA